MANTKRSVKVVEQRQIDNIVLENARILFRNFRGQAQPPYNPEGQRNFCVLLPEEYAEVLLEDGWNVKRTKPTEDNEVGEPFLQVKVNFDSRYPPQIWMVSEKKGIGNKIIEQKTQLDEGDVGNLDLAHIQSADLIIRPYQWSNPTGSGVSAYVKTMYVKIILDELEQKYANVQDSSVHSSEPIDDNSNGDIPF